MSAVRSGWERYRQEQSPAAEVENNKKELGHNFLQQFTLKNNLVVQPLFRQFVGDARSLHFFAQNIEDVQDSKDRPIIGVNFIPYHESELFTPENTCTLRVIANWHDQTVEFETSLDNRDGKPKPQREILDFESLKAEALTQRLEDFFVDALKKRDEIAAE